jgi:hypothetical protein
MSWCNISLLYYFRDLLQSDNQLDEQYYNPLLLFDTTSADMSEIYTQDDDSKANEGTFNCNFIFYAYF